MNKLTKIGASALCGSLAVISTANAGELTVTGGVAMTWTSLSGQVTGNPLGMASNLTFAGSGELDNGWNVALSIAQGDAGAYSNTNIVIGVAGVGDIRVDQGVSGTGIQRMDDLTPSVWEEADGAGLSAGIAKVTGVSAAANIEFTPSSDYVPAGLTLVAAWSPDADSGSTVGDKAASGDNGGALQSGWDFTATATDELHGVSGLTLYGGISRVDQRQTAGTIVGDSEEQVYGVKYALGGFTAGYQRNDDDTGVSGAGSSYENTMYSVTFSVNDNLSVGYNHVESDKTGGNTAEASSYQIAYTMGGATISIADVDVTNQSYASSGRNLEATIVKLGLAF